MDEMERAAHSPRLANPLEVKRRMGLTSKTDKLDAKGLAILLRNGTLPEAWIPPGAARDLLGTVLSNAVNDSQIDDDLPVLLETLCVDWRFPMEAATESLWRTGVVGYERA